MNIIIERENEDRLADGVDTLLSLNDKDFEEVVARLSTDKYRYENIIFNYQFDICAVPSNPIQLGLEKKWDSLKRYLSRDYHTLEHFETSEIFQKLAEKQKEFEQGSVEYERASRLLETRNLEQYKTMELGKYDRKLVDKAFSVFESREAYAKFMDYENNQDYFSVNGKPVPVDNYIKVLGDTFGRINDDGKFVDLKNEIYKDFYIPNIEEYKQKYANLYYEMNFDRVIDPKYKFEENAMLLNYRNIYEIIRKGEEENWTVNQELQDAVFQNMPEDLSTEEKAMYIYCKLCKELSYDDGYVFRKHLSSGTYTPEFSKKKLESIKPSTKITCWDFSRIYAKMINDLGEDIEAVVIAQGEDSGHMSNGFFTNNASVMLDATDATRSKKNDLMRVKQGLRLNGIQTISDKNGYINNAVQKVYPMVTKRKPKSVNGLLNELRELSKQDSEVDIETKLKSFAEIMKKEGMSENEATQCFKFYCLAGYFGNDFENTYIGKRIKEDRKRYIQKVNFNEVKK